MALRRNIISLIVWISVIIILGTHLILNRKDDSKLVSQRSITQIKTTILKRTESEKINYNHGGEKMDEENSSEGEYNHDQQNHKSSSILLANSTIIENNRLKVENAENIKLIQRLSEKNYKLLEKEKQFKNLARRLAAKLKGKEGGTLPKLDSSIPWVFAITPTFARFTQKADLIRLSQTLQHVTNFHWILVEDSNYRSDLVSRFLQESGLSFAHLNIRTSKKLLKKKGEKYNKHHRGVEQRNLALKWLRSNVDPKKTPGVVYFMDDDNTYHKKIFDQMRWTKHVSVWPVGISGGARFAGPIVENGKVVGFHTNWAKNRSFPIDMAGFSANLKLLIIDKSNVIFDKSAKRGWLEPTFLSAITTKDQLEPLANNCTEVLVWHTRTEVPTKEIKGEQELIKLGRPSNPNIEV